MIPEKRQNENTVLLIRPCSRQTESGGKHDVFRLTVNLRVNL